VFDIIRKAELELGDMSGPALQSAAQTVSMFWEEAMVFS
jgi:hypothetical protein